MSFGVIQSELLQDRRLKIVDAAGLETMVNL